MRRIEPTDEQLEALIPLARRGMAADGLADVVRERWDLTISASTVRRWLRDAGMSFWGGRWRRLARTW